jgi:hypothetical protein
MTRLGQHNANDFNRNIKQKMKDNKIDPTLPNLFENHQGSLQSCPYHWTIAKNKKM